MALTLVTTGAYAPDPGDNTIQDVATTGPHVVVADVRGFVGCTIQMSWRLQMDNGTYMTAWSADVLDLTVTPVEGFVLPPIPVIRSAELHLDLIDGSPTDVITWDLLLL